MGSIRTLIDRKGEIYYCTTNQLLVLDFQVQTGNIVLLW